MSTYMNANQPYQRINPDSVVNGMMIGAASAAAATGFAHAGVSLGARRHTKQYQTQMSQLNTASQGTRGTGADNYFGPQRERVQNAYNSNRSVRRKGRYFGSGLRGALTYGATAAVGGLVGGITDSYIDR